MYRILVSIISSVMFLVFLTAPTVIMLFDDTADVSIFYTSNEEEEEKEKSNEKDKELLCYEYPKLRPYLGDVNLDLGSTYLFKGYVKPHLNLISPPPELKTIILV